MIIASILAYLAFNYATELVIERKLLCGADRFSSAFSTFQDLSTWSQPDSKHQILAYERDLPMNSRTVFNYCTYWSRYEVAIRLSFFHCLLPRNARKTIQ